MKRHQLPLALLWIVTQTACPMDDDDDDGAADEHAGSSDASTSGLPGSDDGTSTSASSTIEPGTSTDDGSDTEIDPGTSGSETTGATLYTLSGTVQLGADLELVGDGIGNLYIGAFASCGHDGMLLGFAVVPEADVSAGAQVPFELVGLPSGSVHLAYFLDDDGDADPLNPLPDGGDPSYADEGCDGILSCVPIEVEDADLSDVMLELNLVHPECRD